MSGQGQVGEGATWSSSLHPLGVTLLHILRTEINVISRLLLRAHGRHVDLPLKFKCPHLLSAQPQVCLELTFCVYLNSRHHGKDGIVTMVTDPDLSCTSGIHAP